MEEMVRNTSHVLCGQFEMWYSYAFLFLSLSAFVSVQLFLLHSSRKVWRRKKAETRGNSRTLPMMEFCIGTFHSFLLSRICVRFCSLRPSVPLAPSRITSSHSATHKYEAYDHTDVIFFINHRRKTDSSDVAGPENTTQLSLATFFFLQHDWNYDRFSSSSLFFRLEYEGQPWRPFYFNFCFSSTPDASPQFSSPFRSPSALRNKKDGRQGGRMKYGFLSFHSPSKGELRM